MIYKSPINKEGKEYPVPVVVKNKDFLTGYLDAFAYLLFVLDYQGSIDSNLHSSRFNDVIAEGVHLSDMSRSEIEEVLLENVKQALPEEQKKKQKDHPDNKSGVLAHTYLDFECECGMYYAFHNKHEIPEENFKCGVCDRLLIDYTGFDDCDFEFDGDEDKVAEMEKLAKFHEDEMNKQAEEDEENEEKSGEDEESEET